MVVGRRHCVGSLPWRWRFVLCLLTRVWPAPPMRCNPHKGGSPRPAGSVPRGGRRPDRDSSTHTTTEQENTKCHFHHPPTQQLSSGSSHATPSSAPSRQAQATG